MTIGVGFFRGTNMLTLDEIKKWYNRELPSCILSDIIEELFPDPKFLSKKLKHSSPSIVKVVISLLEQYAPREIRKEYWKLVRKHKKKCKALHRIPLLSCKYYALIRLISI